MNKKIKGTKDYFGLESKKIDLVFKILEKTAKEFGYSKIIIPTIENTNLFLRAVGNETDITNKEMYSFKDRKERMISLRPEGTAGAVRLAIENNLLDNNQTPNFYYISNMFRYERPQKGRQREFFQFGVESFGKSHLFFDLEIIQFAKNILDKFKISKYELQINTIGSLKDREKYNFELKKFISSKIDKLSKYAIEKYNSNNVFRIFDSKIEKDLIVLKDAPKLSEFISQDSLKKFESLKKILKKNNIKYKVNDFLVRGLDYYNDLIFEFVSTDLKGLGSKSTIIAGGRYDSLVKKIDNSKDIPGIGFAIGIERLILSSKEFIEKSINKSIDYYIVVAYNEEDMNLVANDIAKKLRKKGNSVIVDYSEKKILKKISNAEKLFAKNIIIVGNEIKQGKVTQKNLLKNKEEELNIKEI